MFVLYYMKTFLRYFAFIHNILIHTQFHIFRFVIELYLSQQYLNVNVLFWREGFTSGTGLYEIKSSQKQFQAKRDYMADSGVMRLGIFFCRLLLVMHLSLYWLPAALLLLPGFSSVISIDTSNLLTIGLFNSSLLLNGR